MRRGTQQDTEGAHALVFVEPAFFVTPPDVAGGELERYRNDWGRFES